MKLCKKLDAAGHTLIRKKPVSFSIANSQNEFVAKQKKRIMATPVPTATIAFTQLEPLKSETFQATVTFVNSAAGSIGFAPGWDLTFGPEVDVLDADLTFAAVWDASQTRWETTGGSPVTEHPLDSDLPLMPNPGTDGTQWYYFALPYSSYGDTQPTLVENFDVTFKASELFKQKATASVRPFFRLGTDAESNPTTDPPIIGTLATVATESELMPFRVVKFSDLDKDKTQAGPNYVYTQTTQVFISTGLDLPEIRLTDALDNFQRLVTFDASSVTGVTGGGGTLTLEAAAPPLTTLGTYNVWPPAKPTSINMFFNPVTGLGPGTPTIVATYTLGYNDDTTDNLGVPGVINGVGSDTSTDQTNNFKAEAPVETVTSTPGTEPISMDVDYTVRVNPLSIRKTLSIPDATSPPPVLPGMVGNFMHCLTLGDYSAINRAGLLVTDELDETWDYVSDSMELTYDGVTTPILDSSTALTIVVPTGAFGTELTLDLDDPASGIGDAIIYGAMNIAGTVSEKIDLTPTPPPDPATKITITYQARIRETYRSDPTDYIDVGDIGTNTGSFITTSARSGATMDVDDEDETSAVIGSLSSSKTIHAINGVLYTGTPAVPDLDAGDKIAYRITHTFTPQHYESLTLDEFFPLPVLDVSTLSGPISTAAPALTTVGMYYGPTHNVEGTLNTGPSPTINNPTVTINAAANAVLLDFGEKNGTSLGAFPPGYSQTIDVFFVLEIQFEPTEDQLTLTNQMVRTQNGTQGSSFTDVLLQGVVVNQPAIKVTKSVLKGQIVTT
jgi:hypothetical protein